MTHVTCGLTVQNRDQLRNPTIGNRVWAIPLLSLERTPHPYPHPHPCRILETARVSSLEVAPTLRRHLQYRFGHFDNVS